MKGVIFLLLLVVCSSVALGLSPDKFVSYGSQDGTIDFQVSIPQEVYQNTPFSILLVLDPQSASGELGIELLAGGNLLESPTPLKVSFQGEDEMLLNWTTSIDDYTEFSLGYVDGDIVNFAIQPKQKTIVDRKLQETVSFEQPLTENQKEFLITLINENEDIDFTYSLGQFLEDEVNAEELVTFEKKAYVETLIYNDNSSTTQTVVVIDITGKDVITDLKIIETIPKDFAVHVDNISFSLTPIVLEEDPVIMWHLEGVEDKRIQYSVDGNATLTGNTILLTSVIDEEDISNSPTPSKDIWLPILIIPLVAGVIIFFSKYSPKKK